MRHCLLITVYKDVESLNRIIKYTPSEWGVYIHIDKKSTILENQIIDGACVKGVYKKYKVYWGGVEHLKAFIFLMRMAASSSEKYDFFHLISGQDFYASSLSNFDRMVVANNNYMGIFPLPNKHWGWESGYSIFKYRTFSSKADIRKQPWRLMNSILKYSQIFLRVYRKLPDYPLFGGPVYSSLSYDFVKWCLESPMAKDLLTRLKNSTCAEEVYFQTLIMNSPFRDTVQKDVTLRYIDWNANPAPKYLDIDDYAEILKSNSLFCRKIDSIQSAALIEKLELLCSKS